MRRHPGLLAAVLLAAACRKAPTPPVPVLEVLEPAAGAVLPAGQRAVRLSWRPAPSHTGVVMLYNAAVRDETDPAARDWRNNCEQDEAYVCSHVGLEPSVEVPLTPGHRYSYSVYAIEPGYGTGRKAEGEFSAAPGPPPPEEELEERLLRWIAETRPLLERYQGLAAGYGELSGAALASMEQERASRYSRIAARQKKIHAARIELDELETRRDVETASRLLEAVARDPKRRFGSASALAGAPGFLGGRSPRRARLGAELDRLHDDVGRSFD